MRQLRYVKSPEEVRRLQAIYAAPDFLKTKALSISFETDPEVQRAILPPPLQPADRPLVSVGVFEIGESNCVGAFNGGSINVACKHNGVEGNYCVTMPMDTDFAVIFGRELYGEPKKVATARLQRTGNRFRGTIERYGVTYIELEAEMTADLDALPSTASEHFYFKYLPSPDGLGFDSKPKLVQISHRGKLDVVQTGTGTVTFRESPHDPVVDIPIVNVLEAVYSEGETHTSGKIVAEVDPEAFLPYMFGKLDDLTVGAGVPVLAGR
jgi:acetoacetate decarboxylase